MKAGDSIGGRYQIEEELGRGGRGVVYRVLDTHEHTTVALKVLLDSFHEGGVGAALEREFGLLSDLSHPGLVRVLSLGGYYYTMEYVRGTDFRTAVRDRLARAGSDGKLQIVLDLAVQLAEALAYLHDRGVVHRDLSPGNVLVDTAGKVRLADFGLAEKTCLLDRLAPDKLRGGSPRYLAPERIRGEEAEERSDLYSLGLLLYEACTGIHPFTDPDPAQVLLNQLTRRQPPLRSYWNRADWGLERVIERLLEKEPEDRFQSAGEVLAALRCVADGRSGTGPTRLLGRNDAMHEVSACTVDATRTGTALLLLEGAEGSGKTRMLEEVSSFLTHRGWCVLHGWCRSDSPTSYAPWCRIMAEGLACLHKLDPRRAANVAGRWAAALGGSACYPWVDPERPPASFDTAGDAMAGVLGLLSHRWPVCVLVDDLHLGHPSSFEILGGLLGRNWSGRVVFCTSVAGDCAPIRDLMVARSAMLVPLRPLAVQDAVKLALELVGEQKVDGSEVSRVLAQAEGNPRKLIFGMRPSTGGSPHPLRGAAAGSSSQAVRGAELLARAEAALADGKPHRVAAALQALTHSGSIPESRRRRGQVLNARRLVHLGRLTEAVDQYEEATVKEPQAASEAAVSIYGELSAVHVALGRADDARHLLQQVSSSAWLPAGGAARHYVELVAGLLETETRGGVGHVRSLAGLAEAANQAPPALLGRVALAEARWGLWQRARTHAQTALDRVRGGGDAAAIAECLLSVARSLLLEGKFRESLRSAREALHQAREASHRPLIGDAYGLLGLLHRLMGSPGRARNALARCLGSARETGVLSQMSHAERELSLVGMYTGRNENGDELLAAARTHAGRSGLWWERVQSDGALALHALSLGQQERAARTARRALLEARSAENPLMQGLAHGWVAVAERDLRPRGELWHHYRTGRRLLLDGGFPYHEAMMRLAYGEWLLSRDSRRAHPVVREARGDLADMGALGAYRDPMVAGISDAVEDETGFPMDLVGRLSEASDAENLVIECVRSAVVATGAERGFLVFRELESGTRLTTGVDMSGDRLCGDAATASHGIVDRVLRSGQPVASLDAQADGRFSDRWSVQEYGIRSVLCVPLIEGGEARAALYLDNRFVPELFGPAELRRVRRIALQCAPTVFLARRAQRLDEMFTGTIRALAAAVDAKDPYTRGHSRRVSRIAMAVADELGLDASTVRLLELASLLHDVGKIGTPDTLLTSRDPLAPEDIEVARQHPLLGAQIVSPIPHSQDIVAVVLQHHENLDGSGYPLGLRGDQIGLPARIVAVADAVDAMTTDRPYRIRLSLEEACLEIRRCVGTQFDPVVVDALFTAVERGRVNPGGG